MSEALSPAGTAAAEEISLQSMRAEIAAELGVPPGTVTDDADLIGLGMDSMRGMRLAGRWRRRGAGVRFADLAAEPTLASWWAAVRATTAADAAGAGAPAPPVEFDETAPFALTPVQHAYWVGRADGQVLGGVGCHAYLEFDPRQPIDPDRIESAVRALVRRHGMLRARFLDDGTQIVPDDDPWPGLTVHDLRTTPAERLDAALTEIRDRLSHRRFDAAAGELFDVRLTLLPGGRCRLHIEVDFLAADVLGLRIVLDDLARLHLAPDDPPAPLTYSFARYQAERAATVATARAADRAWWRERLADLPGAPQLPLAVDPARITAPRFVRREAWLPVPVWRALGDRARRHGLTPAMVLATAYAEVLGRWSGAARLLLNLPLFDREESQHPDVAHLVADFTDLILLPIDLTVGRSFAERAHAVQDRFRETARHTAYSGVDVLRDVARAGGSAAGTAVFACNLGSELITDNVREAFGAPGWMITQTPQVWLDHQINEYPDGVHLALDAVEELFAPGVLDALFGAYTALLNGLAERDWACPVTVGLPPCQAEVRAAVNRTGAPVRGGLLHAGFFERAAREPDRPAVLGDGLAVTHGELADRALRVAGALRAAGVVPGDLVGVSLPRGADQVAAVLGVLAAGAGYVPVGVDQPAARRARIVSRAAVRVTLAVTDLPGAGAVLPIEDARAAEPLGEPVAVDPSTSAYVIFTSGSTGEPKGVEVSHEAAWNTVDDVCTRWGVGPADRVLAVSALDFDLSVFDVFGLLGVGGAVVVVPDADRRDARAWVRLCDQHGVTVWNSVPVLLEMLLAADGGRSLPSRLRLALVSGDWAAVDLPARVTAASDGRCRLMVLGGATEAAIWSNAFDGADVDPDQPSIPYGFPLRGQRYRVVDELGRDCPDWVTGELWIGGAGVATGYRGDPELTAERFPEADDGRWYRTGDLGRYRPDGSLEFLGRVDTQVKVRGHRIELGEIEAALEASPDVDRAVVVAPGERTSRRLVGFVTPQTADPAVLATQLADRLPAHAIPPVIEPLAELPLTANGKLDRATLTRWATEQGRDAAPSEPPRGPLEQLVAQVWAALLETPVTDRDADFFTLGGDSLIATRVIGELRARQVDGATLSGLFGSPRLSAFAADLVLGAPTATGPVVVADPERRHEPFPPTEVQRAYWLGRSDRFTLGGVGCHFYTEVEGPGIDLDRLTEAWNALIARHEMLRVVFDEDGMQRVLPSVPRFEIGRVADTAQLRELMSHQVLDPARWPVFDVRAAPTDSGGVRVGISIDAILLDALSVLTLRRELDLLYARPDTQLPPVDLSFRDYQTAMHPGGPALDAAREYWTDRLPQLPPAPGLPLVTDPVEVDRPRFARREGRIAAPRWASIQAVARRHGLTPSTVLAAAYGEVLAAWSAQPELTLTFTLFDRRDVHPQVWQVLGDFTSLLLAAYRGGEDRLAAARALQRDVAGALDHGEVSAVWVLRELARRSAGSVVTMPVVFTSMLGVQGLPGLRSGDTTAPAPFGEEGWGVSQTPQVWLDCQVGEVPGEDGAELLLRWDAVAELFDPAALDTMFAAFLRLVDALADDDWSAPAIDTPVGDGPRAPRSAADPAPAGTDATPGPPRAGAEQTVALLWGELLSTPVTSRTDNFFVLGGDSLAATRLVEMVERRTGAELSLRRFFAAPTVVGCAAAIADTDHTEMEEGVL